MSMHQTLITEIERFLKRHDMAPTTFGLRAVNDAKLVANLRAGFDVRTRTADRIRDFMEAFEKSKNPKHRRGAYQPAA